MNNFLEIRQQWIIIIKGNQEDNNAGTIAMNKSFEELEFSSENKNLVLLRSLLRCDKIEFL